MHGDSKVEKDTEVQPLIGAILLIVVLILAKVIISSIVFGMTEDIQQTKVVAITSELAQDILSTQKAIDITNHGGKDIGAVISFQIFVDGQECQPGVLGTNTGSSIRLDLSTPACGSTIIPGSRNHILIVGNFRDATNQVLLDTYQ